MGTARERVRAAAERAVRAWLELNRRSPRLRRAWGFTKEVLGKFRRDDCLSHAASIGFFLTISLIPLATLLFRLMAVVLGSGAYSLRLQRAIAEMYPYLPDNFIRNTIAQSKRIDGWSFAWVVLLLGANWGVTQLDRSLAHIFGRRRAIHPRTRMHDFARRLGVVLVGIVFLVILLSAGFEWSLRRHAILPPTAALTLLPAAAGLLLTTLILHRFPRRPVRPSHALAGASVTTFLWWAAKGLFGLYYTRARDLTWNILYGSLGDLMAALLFLYYSCCTFLLGAEVAAVLCRREDRAARRGPHGNLRQEQGETIPESV